MSNTIMIPLDGSPFAEEALPLGMSLARQTGSSLKLVRVAPLPGAALPYLPTNTWGDVAAMLGKEAQSYLERIVERAAQQVEVTSELLQGATAEAIAEQANEEQVAYLVMATHGLTGVSRWALGSVADRV